MYKGKTGSGEMKKKMNLVKLIFFILFFISCNKESEKTIKKEENILQEKLEQSVFKEKSIERLIEEFEENSRKNKIEIEKFEKIIFENKKFYYSKVKIKENTNYTIGYEGITPIGLFLKVGVITGSDLGIIEDMVVNLIQVSDMNMSEEEARNLYTEILATMGENELTSSIKHRNGITYGIQIGKESGELLFSAQ